MNEENQPKQDTPVQPPANTPAANNPNQAPHLEMNRQIPPQANPPQGAGQQNPATLPAEQEAKKPKRLFMYLLAILALGIGAGTYILFFNGKQYDEPAASTVFTEIEGEISDEELFSNTIERLLKVSSVTYTVDQSLISNSSGEVTIRFSESGPQLYSDATLVYEGDGGSIELEMFIDTESESTFFKINEIKGGSIDESWNEFIGKWVVINEESTENIAAGSEYIGLLLFGTVNWEMPFLIGDLSNMHSLAVQLKADGVYQIVESENTNLNGVEARKLVVSADKSMLSDALSDFTGLDATKTLNATTPGSSIYVNRYSDEKPKPATFTVWISKDNARLLAAEFVFGEAETGTLGSPGDYFKYNDFIFNDSDMPGIPKNPTPFNEFYPTE